MKAFLFLKIAARSEAKSRSVASRQKICTKILRQKFKK